MFYLFINHKMNEQIENVDKQEQLLNISMKLLEIYDYINDKDCELHTDDFMYVIMEDIDKIMKNLKDIYYEIYTYRKHQRT